MAHLLRLFEMECLTQLVNHIDIEKEWIPLYREWLVKENIEYANLNILRKWMDNINKITGFSCQENINMAIEKYIEEYPIDTQTNIIFGIKLC